jgi:hypothetical protein
MQTEYERAAAHMARHLTAAIAAAGMDLFYS